MGAGEAPGTGVATFLFTDIEGSTWLVQHLGDEWDRTLHDHYRLLREAWMAHNGYEVHTEGDAFFVAFADAADAVAAALDAQRKLDAHRWAMESRLRVRIGLHTGEARVYDGDYVGLAVHQAARVKSAAHGGQIIVSDATKAAAGAAFSFGDLGLHRLKDLAQPVRLYEVIDQQRPISFPPPKTLSVMPNNFPVQSTTFVGRDDDVARIKDAFERARLVTLTGAGGIGKTRLSLQAGAELIDAFPDGAWLVDLAPLADPARVALQVGAALGVPEQPGRAISNTVTDHLLDKKTLLVFDNCEHLIDASAGLAQRILETCPDVSVLATSREALNVPGESTLRLRSLGLPAEGDVLESASKAESVRLFCQRATAVRPGFELGADNVADVIHICQRLDGLPLAIELAAARMRALSAKEIAERLDDRFRLLTGGARLALPRQRTLEATVSWSYDLLADDERRLFERLSVFSGGSGLEGVERVCSGDGIEEIDVLDLLTKLVDKSLVVADEQIEGHTRFKLLETLRQFGKDRLIEHGEMPRVRDRHLDWVVALASQLPGQTGMLLPSEIEADSDNLRTAIEWSIESGRHEGGLSILADVWTLAGHFEEREAWQRALLPSADRVSTPIRARAFAAAGGISFMMGDWETAAERYQRAAAAAIEAGDTHIAALSVMYEGGSRFTFEGQEERALELVQRGLDIARDAGDGEMIRRALLFQAWAQTGRDLDLAFEIATDVDAQSRAEGTNFDRAHAREVLALILALRGDLRDASACIVETLPLFDRVLRGCSAHVLETAAALAAMYERYPLGATLWGAADRIRRETGDKARPWERLVQTVWLPKIFEALDAEAFLEARARGDALERDAAFAYARHELAQLAGND